MTPRLAASRSVVQRCLTAALTWLLLLALGACGGGGGGNGAPALNPPVIGTQPTAQTVDDGATATFAVAASSATALSYQWRKNGTAIGGETAATITLAASYADNGARFSVVVANADGSVISADAVLTVTPLAPTISTQPTSLTVPSGSAAAFAVVVSGGTGPINFQWRRNGVAIVGATASAYTLAAAAPADDAALFSVAITSPSGTLLSSAATLTVSAAPPPPAITTQPQNQTAALGQTATFSVVATSATAISYQWSRNGTVIVGATGASYTTAALVAGDDGARFSVALTNNAGTTVSSVATLTISNLPLGVTQVSAGAAHSVALKSDGTVWSWGSTVGGLRGVGSDAVGPGETTRAKNSNGSVFNGVVGVSAGYGFTIAVKGDGTVWAWGLNGAGLGDGTTLSRSNPVQVVDAAGAPFTGVTQASAGSFFTLAVKADGSVWGWGSNSSRMLGDGTNTNRVNPVPVLDAAGGTFGGAVRVAAGQTHSMALKTDGTLWAWGVNTSGQIGSGSAVGNIGLPARVETAAGVPLTNVVSFAAGQLHSAAVRADGTAYAWGHNTQGSLGDGTTTNRSRPVPVKDSAGNALTGIVAVAAGDYFTMFLKSDGTVWATGMNNFGQLGDNTAAAMQINPAAVKDAGGTVFGSVDRVALSQRHTVVRRTDGSVWAWGENVASQLGDATTATRTNPVRAAISGP